MSWQPSATLDNLRARAKLLADLRHFFAERNVLEVETPVLSYATVTNLHVHSIPAFFQMQGSDVKQTYYLQTSPEYAMKRLLAAGSGAIYQISKAFRQGDLGHIHNPEFTMLEWYRPGYDHHQLMDEMDVMLQQVFYFLPAERQTYQTLFEKHLGINPHTATVMTLVDCAKQQGIDFSGELTEKDAWLDLLWTHVIEPRVGQTCPLFLYDFPASQAALAKIRTEDHLVASRFEVYYQGIELANGFHELQDAVEQERRFEEDRQLRRTAQLPDIHIDQLFLAALKNGFPDCAGVAVGIDRLIMLALNKKNLADVLSFSFERA